MTKYEAEIYDIIYTSHAHLTSEEIFFKLKEKEPKVVLATIYNNINKLYKDGKIRKISMNNEPDRYDITSRHDHLVCQRCHKIMDFSFADLTSKIEKELGEQIEGYELRISYICPECRKII